MVRVKICGLSNSTDALQAAEMGADAIGVVFAPSRRLVSSEQAKKIAQDLPPFISLVGVFVNEELELVNRLVENVGLDMVQLHGEEGPDYCSRVKARVIKAIPVKEGYIEDLKRFQGKVNGFLLDTYVPGIQGGTGQTFDWSAAVEAKNYGRVILAGGLTPENVRMALDTVHPYGVDVSSGVESSGKKDMDKIQRFLENVRRYDYERTTR